MVKFELKDNEEAKALFGRYDENLKAIEKRFNIKLKVRGNSIMLEGQGKPLEQAESAMNKMLKIIHSGIPLKKEDVNYILIGENDKEKGEDALIDHGRIIIPSKKHYIAPKTEGQKEYVKAIKSHDMVIVIGPAGTGKTYLAMAMAVSALEHNQVNRLILTRPALEAGEKLGFLPGDLYDKVTPFLRPLYDALYEMMQPDRIHSHIESGTIEVAPLGYMRGRTFNDSFIIMDEAQNTTKEQMKMFLTRMGFGSKIVITGDITQSDLPGGQPAGLMQASQILKDIEGIKIIKLGEHDVVRHELVQQIIKAYESSG